MATTTTITTSFNGQFAGEFVSAALLKAPTLDNGLITIKPNVKYKSILKRLSTGSLIQADSCDFDASGNITLDERELEVKMLKVNMQECKSDFEDDYLALEMGDSAHSNIPANFQTYLINYMQGKVAAENEVMIWQGVSGAASYDGFETLFAADATVIDVVGEAITPANVIAELTKVHAAIPAQLITADDLQIVVSPGVAQAYVIALGGFASNVGGNGVDGKGQTWFNGGSLSFGGVALNIANGLSAGNIVAGTKSNLVFGTSLMSDAQEVKVIDMSPIDMSQNVRLGMRFAAGVQYAFGAEIVYYKQA